MRVFQSADVESNPVDFENHFDQLGWGIVELSRPDPVQEARDALLSHLRKVAQNSTINLEDYQELFLDDAGHTSFQHEITTYFRSQKFARKIILENLGFFQTILGRDLNLQTDPYLRITRPNMPQDNIGYHRDTFYGGSPYELSVLIPYVDVLPEASLKVWSGSHKKSEKEFPFEQIENPDRTVVKNSTKHQLGFLYAPKVLTIPDLESKMTSLPLKVGQVLIFSLSTLHGSVLNRSPFSRWSSDVRICSAHAPIDLSARPTYYEPLARSMVSRNAEQYFAAQTKE